MDRIRIALLGGLDVESVSGQPFRLSSRKSQGLLAYLALHPGTFYPRDTLATLLWGEASDERARHSLRQALTNLRRALASPSVLLERGEAVALNPAAVDVDVDRFERLVAEATPEALGTAAGLYRGDLLQGIGGGEPAYEEWLLSERERLRELALDTLARLVAHHTKAGATEPAIQAAVRLLALDPTQEATHRALLRLYARQGRRGAALRQYQLCVEVLARELGVEPEDETKRLYQEILQVRSAPEDAATPVSEPGATATLLVGRAPELAQLLRALDEGWRGEGRAFLVLGEAGIGKTRLLGEVVAEARTRGGRVLLGHAHESEQIMPLGPWVEALRASGALADLARRGAGTDSWRAELARLFPELGTARSTGAPTAQDYLRLFEAIAQLLGWLARSRPLLVVLEDLHWADEMSLRLLSFLSRRVAGWPALLVGTAREEDLADAPLLQRVLAELDRDERLARVSLPPLSREETLALVEAMVRSGTEPTTIARLGQGIWEVSEGNPFTVVETMRALRESDASEAGALPPRVRDTIASRLEQLSRAGQALAAVAAVVGRACDFALLREAAGMSPPEAAEAVEALVARRILHVAGEHLDFTHDRVRTVAYERLLTPRRRVLHAAVAGALAKLHAGRLDDIHEQLAFHYARADQTDLAVDHLVRFADQAARVYAYAQAVEALAQAGTHLRRGTSGNADRRVLDVALRQSFYLSILGRFDEIRDLLARERDRLERVGDPNLVGPYFFRLGLTHQNLGEFEPAVEAAERALAAARRCGDDATAGKTHYMLALASCYLGRLREGLEHGARAVELLTPSEETHWQGLAHWILGWLHAAIGQFDQALAAAATVASIGDSTSDPRLQSFAAWVRGIALAGQGQASAAVESCRRAVEVAMDPLSRAVGSGWLGWAHLEAGDAAGAIPHLESSVADLQRIGLRHVAGRSSAVLGEALLLVGEPEAALARAREGLAVCLEMQYPQGAGVAERALARIAVAMGAPLDARRHLDDALARFVAIDAVFDAARTRMALAEVVATLGDLALARRHLEDARRDLERIRVPAWLPQLEDVATRLGLSPRER
jgi:DNA-binding SARP family transcriptional activator